MLAGLVVVGLVALLDTWREALLTAQGVSDRVLAGSALAIAERVTLDESGGLQVDIPYSALDIFEEGVQERVFYSIIGPGGAVITGYDDLPFPGLLRPGVTAAMRGVIAIMGQRFGHNLLAHLGATNA